MSGKAPKRKGTRIERELVKLLLSHGIKAARIPLSGSAGFRGERHDVDVYIYGEDCAPLVSEVKGRKSGDGFRMLGRWLGPHDQLFLRQDRDQFLAVLPQRVYLEMARKLKEAQRRIDALLASSKTGGDHATTEILSTRTVPAQTGEEIVGGDAPRKAVRVAHCKT